MWLPESAPALRAVSMPVLTALSVNAATNESLCASYTKLTGTTTVFAKPGMGKQLLDMAATMPGVHAPPAG